MGMFLFYLVTPHVHPYDLDIDGNILGLATNQLADRTVCPPVQDGRVGFSPQKQLAIQLQRDPSASPLAPALRQMSLPLLSLGPRVANSPRANGKKTTGCRRFEL